MLLPVRVLCCLLSFIVSTNLLHGAFAAGIPADGSWQADVSAGMALVGEVTAEKGLRSDVRMQLAGAWFPQGNWGLFATYEKGRRERPDGEVSGNYIWDTYNYLDSFETVDITFGGSWRWRAPDIRRLLLEVRVGLLYARYKNAERRWGNSEPPDIESVADYVDSQWGWVAGFRMLCSFWHTGSLAWGVDLGLGYRRSFDGILGPEADELLIDTNRADVYLTCGLSLGRF